MSEEGEKTFLALCTRYAELADRFARKGTNLLEGINRHIVSFSDKNIDEPVAYPRAPAIVVAIQNGGYLGAFTALAAEVMIDPPLPSYLAWIDRKETKGREKSRTLEGRKKKREKKERKSDRARIKTIYTYKGSALDKEPMSNDSEIEKPKKPAKKAKKTAKKTAKKKRSDDSNGSFDEYDEVLPKSKRSKLKE